VHSQASQQVTVNDDGKSFRLMHGAQPVCAEMFNLVHPLEWGMKHFSVTVSGTIAPGKSSITCKLQSDG
jgi:hypothetical protein